jgi:Family of unknown function (DUF6335)
MKKRETPKRRKRKAPRTSAPKRRSDTEALAGPPARETVWEPSDQERRAQETLREYTSSSPALSGGDVDADWQRADSVGEEAPGGTVATPDQDVVDDLGKAFGVPRAPDEPFRPSAETLDARDRARGEQEE